MFAELTFSSSFSSSLFIACLLLQDAIIQLNMNPSKQQQLAAEESDIFDSEIMPEGNDPKQNIQDAVRCSMLARGIKVDQGKIGEEEWPLKIRQEEPKETKIQVVARKAYGQQGQLFKQSPSLFGGWEERYCVLKGQRFIYKEDKYPTSLNAGILNFNLLSCEIEAVLKGNHYISFNIRIRNCDKSFTFKAATPEETHKWVYHIKQAIEHSAGWQKNYTYLANYPRFWRKDYESESEFRDSAQTGDIVLFRGKKNTSMMQRALTMDEFDHVGVVLRNGKGDSLILEANGGFGVGLMPWSRLVSKQWFKQYELIVHRHLNILRSEQFLAVVEKFVTGNLGKKYDFSLKDFFFNRQSNAEDNDAYFCSSLVAKIYKKLELLDPSKSSKQYLPSSFSNKESLSLRGDGRFGYAFLDDEKIVVFQGSQ